ncbi:DEAD/DEAH box helicase [Magnetospirillum molischianum]|uniref:DEAD/DEAH box helicase n=1 Tax=Magnetospirillum molischianum TaxID=1083 RepID=UPI0002FF10D4|nr:DEAD/DEAH box helicase [Magnetospirillum molischianum]
MAVIQIAANAIVAKLFNADRDVKLCISELLSYKVDGYEYTDAYKSKGWDGRSSFFDMRSGTFPAGFFHKVHSELIRLGHRVQLVKKPLPAPLGPENPIVDGFGNDDPRYDYQMETVRRLLKLGQMVAQVATGGGKSKIAKLAVARIRRPTLFLTTRSVLMYQMADGFREAGFVPGILGDSQWEPKKGVNCGMVQTLAAKLKEPDPFDPPEKQARQAAVRAKTIKFLEYFEFLILEEAHEVGSDSFYQVARHCKNAYYRLALTATPFMRQDEESNARLMACIGSIGIKITEKMLIERGILAKPFFKYVSSKCPEKLKRGSSYQRAVNLGIIENQHRNADIVFEAVRAASYGLPVMILVGRKDHGRLLKDRLIAAGLRVEFIFGESDRDKRRTTLKKLGDGRIDVVIGSTILDVGVDVPAVGMVILAGGGKAEIALRQRIGRGLRAKKFGPNVAFIVDFSDEHNSHLKKHALTRRAIVEDTPGFVENILPRSVDFDFEGLGFEARKKAA